MATDTIIIQKMFKYCEDSIKYSIDVDYKTFIENELHLVYSVFALSQLGELATKLSDHFYERYPEIPWRAIRGMRNRIVHDYDGIKFTLLWNILTQDIPLLRDQLMKIININDI
jgi:uncharacterized protein with HEPN domain